MIAIIDYGMGNLRSVQKAFEAVDVPAQVTRNPDTILNADAMVLPGVGAFKDCMHNLEELDLIPQIRKFIESGKPFLGICLGLQLLFEQSSEFGNVPGLGMLPGRVVRFDEGQKSENGVSLKVPHMGWNTLRFQNSCPLLEGIPPESYFYFVHSFHVVPDNKDIIASTTQYGIDFVSGIHTENLFAFQFHPEKSQTLGLAILKNFSKLI
ncbi:MAG: imidazole glycerol phosphate synthase subunit HisH [Candidatus Nitronauta litoralis]|uniref:Imidazole glycerol phosphate synthase subunit HisH n=1 Tax=Candidatus Nitronauta litoralis TaxID=2705533 RepID=A0A7T0BTI5_9BACT|nr:MAG: imidazole glycerol phosphate synthase subunit HisH [Candidatus Nitronauta litoralis]